MKSKRFQPDTFQKLEIFRFATLMDEIMFVVMEKKSLKKSFINEMSFLQSCNYQHSDVGKQVQSRKIEVFIKNRMLQVETFNQVFNSVLLEDYECQNRKN